MTQHDRKHFVTCGNCERSWCEKCDPAPAALCHWCHGRGSSEFGKRFGSCEYHGLMYDYRLTAGSDAWAECMGTFFAVAGEMYWRGLDIPAEWHYGPGALADPREPEDYWFSILEAASDEALEEFGAVMSRYSDALRRAGADY